MTDEITYTIWNDRDSKWYFSVADVIEALTDSANVKDYIKKMRKRDPELNSNWGTICPPLELIAQENVPTSSLRQKFQDMV